MDLLQFTNPNLFKSISLDQETLILVSKDSKYTFHINFKDEIKGVDFYELALATENSSGYINKSGTVKVIQKFVLDVLNDKVKNVEDEDTKENKPYKSNTNKKIAKKSVNNNDNKNKFYKNLKKR
ncbi:hypothetical protein [Romboutsia lituseburensis]|uniref:hypothetical protein n=1 Tax=Romboutsia lituseburensis TaxID=1537 RepID=UPI00215A239B|nr:hypothetical protein [Romboutsia lituseburensis]MCR8744145.1 hypothetical protein [Romboutsia lituseburensis]